MSTAITVNHLTKRYNQVTAVKDISFDVERGSLFAFLGPNGAGKSTTISCLTTLQSPDSGEVTILGHQINKEGLAIRRKLGVVFQESLLDPLLTVRENLVTRARCYGITEAERRIKVLAQLIELDGFLRQRYGTLSGGQRRRTDIARALLHQPEILFLDEPTTGLDPQSRQKVWEIIYTLQGELGLTVFLTTHYMEEAERAAMVYVIDHGKIIAHGTPSALRAHYSQSELRLVPCDGGGLEQKLKAARISYTTTLAGFIIKPRSSQEALELLQQHRASIQDFEFRHGTMDDVFLKLTGHAIRELGEDKA